MKNEEEIVDTLFCGDTCDTTSFTEEIKKKRKYTMKVTPKVGLHTDLRTTIRWTPMLEDDKEVKCDDVCDLLGGPISRVEKVKLFFRLEIPTFFKKFWNSNKYRIIPKEEIIWFTVKTMKPREITRNIPIGKRITYTYTLFNMKIHTSVKTKLTNLSWTYYG